MPHPLLPILALLGPLQSPEPPARALSRELTGTARLAGTTGGLVGARLAARHLRDAGWEVELDAREVLLSLPRRLELAVYEDADATTPVVQRVDRFDPDAIPPGDVPLFNAFSASAEVRAEVVAVGHGLREDYERLAAAGVDVRGCVALAKYGRSYRGIKADLAEEFGCVGVLLYSDPAGDGDGKGAVWPAGPWKPDWAAQRGSISPMARAPGDVSTPGYPSPAPGGFIERLSVDELARALPRIPCMPIGAGHARALLSRLAMHEDGDEAEPTGPGPVEVRLDIDQPLDVRPIYNVIATLRGREDTLVIAGSHRDAWVRGAHDSGSGAVALLRGAQHLGERARAGWRPEHTIVIALWDAEEYGLIGSTEWGEAHAERLRKHALLYVNADAAVSGTRFGASGTPGMLGLLQRVLETFERSDEDGGEATTIWERWSERQGGQPRLGLPGSGSDYTVFLHHLSVPVIDFGFRGNSGGMYHTAFDDFPIMDRYLDPGWHGHELAGRFVARLLAEAAGAPAAGFDSEEAALEMARHSRAQSAWLGDERSEDLAEAFERVAAAVAAWYSGAGAATGDPSFYRRLEAREGLPARPWFRNQLWAPGLETGYSSETLPILAAAARAGDDALRRALDDLLLRIEQLRAAWAPGYQLHEDSSGRLLDEDD
jgi:N-acetylated-alpha-linked acidic dipeptidase